MHPRSERQTIKTAACFTRNIPGTNKVLPRLCEIAGMTWKHSYSHYKIQQKMQQISYQIKNHYKKKKHHKKNPTDSWIFPPIIFIFDILPIFSQPPRYSRMSRDADSKGFNETWTAGLKGGGVGYSPQKTLTRPYFP